MDKVTVAACMTRDPLTIAPDAPVLEAAQLILKHKVSGLPVVADGRVVGVVTESDLFRLLLSENSAAERIGYGRMRTKAHAEQAIP